VSRNLLSCTFLVDTSFGKNVLVEYTSGVQDPEFGVQSGRIFEFFDLD